MSKPESLNRRIEIVEGNIVQQETDAIVNAANESLLGGGGVDGAIHNAAGPQLLEECKKLKGCPTGQAKITQGYKLRAKFVIHTVGPIWRNGRNNEEELLASCYRASLSLAEKNNIHTIAFPSISTGVYRFPMDKAARVALTETKKFLDNNNTITKVVFVCFGHDAWALYLQVAREVFPGFQG